MGGVPTFEAGKNFRAVLTAESKSLAATGTGERDTRGCDGNKVKLDLPKRTC